MRCEDVRAELALSSRVSAGAAQHLAGCADCRARAAQARALDAFLSTDADQEPRPGFDQRFFARLEQAKAVRVAWWRRPLLLVPAATATAALAVALVWPRQPAMLGEDLELAMDLEVIEELEVARALDDVEAFELLAGIDPAQLRKIVLEETR